MEPIAVIFAHQEHTTEPGNSCQQKTPKIEYKAFTMRSHNSYDFHYEKTVLAETVEGEEGLELHTKRGVVMYITPGV